MHTGYNLPKSSESLLFHTPTFSFSPLLPLWFSAPEVAFCLLKHSPPQDVNKINRKVCGKAKTSAIVSCVGGL